MGIRENRFQVFIGLIMGEKTLVHINYVSLFAQSETETSFSLCQEVNSHCRWVTQEQRKKSQTRANTLSVFKCKMTEAFMLIDICFLFHTPIYSIYECLSEKCDQWDLFLQSIAAGYQFISIVPVNPISCVSAHPSPGVSKYSWLKQHIQIIPLCYEFEERYKMTPCAFQNQLRAIVLLKFLFSLTEIRNLPLLKLKAVSLTVKHLEPNLLMQIKR